MVAKYEQLLLENAGAHSVTVDGQSVTFTDLEERYEKWQRKLAAEQGTRPRVAQIDLQGNC